MGNKHGLKVQISKELIEDGHYDIMGELAKKAGQAMARQMEEKLFAEMQKSILSATGVPPHMLGAPTTASGPLTPEMLEDAMQAVKDAPFRIEERIGPAIINPKGIASFKMPEDDPRMMDVLIMREFTELGKPFDEEDLKDFASNAVGQRFDVDWLCDKYPQDSLELFRNKGKEFVVESTDIDYHAYAHKQMEKAVYSVGYVVNKGAAVRKSLPGFQQGELASMNPCSEIMLTDMKVESVQMDAMTQTMNVSVSARAVQPIEQISIDINLKGETE